MTILRCFRVVDGDSEDPTEVDPAPPSSNSYSIGPKKKKKRNRTNKQEKQKIEGKKLARIVKAYEDCFTSISSSTQVDPFKVEGRHKIRCLKCCRYNAWMRSSWYAGLTSYKIMRPTYLPALRVSDWSQWPTYLLGHMNRLTDHSFFLSEKKKKKKCLR